MKEDYIRELKDISVNWPRWNRKRMKKMTKSVSELWNIKKPKVYSTYEILKVDKEVRKVFEKIMTFFFFSNLKRTINSRSKKLTNPNHKNREENCKKILIIKLLKTNAEEKSFKNRLRKTMCMDRKIKIRRKIRIIL